MRRSNTISMNEVDLRELGGRIVAQLTPDLLAPELAKSPAVRGNPVFGHCYVASETLYHMAGGKRSGLKPRRVKLPDGVWHWWLVDAVGAVVDLTAAQFAEPPPYHEGVRASFLTKRPSARARKLMARVLATALKSKVTSAASEQSDGEV